METIKLDLIPGKKMPSLHASQFDDGRAYHIDLTENRVPYVLDGTETISVIVRKCDNTLVSMDIANTFANKSYLEFEVVEQMTACSGFNYGEIILEKNGDRLGSLNFYLVVETAPDENGITSQSEIKNLERQVHDIVVEELADNGAEETGYDNTESGLDATNVQDALDELAQKPSVDAYTKQESDAFITDEYDATSTYAIGDMVIHENALYVCSTAITTAEAWNSSHWTLTDIATAIGTVKMAIPTKTSDLQNDSGFTTIDDSTTANDKTYSSNKINSLVGGVQNEVEELQSLTLTPVTSWNDVTLTIQNGYYRKDTGEFVIDNTRRTSKFNVTAGDVYKLSTFIRPVTISGIVFFDSNNAVLSTLLDGTGTAQTITDYEFTIPNGAVAVAVQSADTTSPVLKKKNSENVFIGYTKEEVNIKVANGGKYGVKWSLSNPDDLGSRCFDAIGKNATIGVGATNGSSDFDSIYPWSEIKRCNIKENSNGATIVTFEGESGFALDGSNGDVFVRIPKFAYERYIEGGYEYRVVSRSGCTHPAFVENGKELDEIFISAFEGYVDGNSKMRSVGGVLPTSNMVAQDFLDSAQANGDNYSLYDCRCVDALFTLISVEFGCRNTNAIIGYGLADFEQPVNNDRDTLILGASNTHTVRTRKWVSWEKALLPVGSNITICDTTQQNILTQAKLLTCVDGTDYTDWTFDGNPITVTTDCFIGSAAFNTNWCENSPTGALSWHTGRNDWITGSITRNAIRYRWIENIFGNLWHFLPDISFNALQMYMCKNMRDYVMHKITSPYLPQGTLFVENSDNGYKLDGPNYNYWVTKFDDNIFTKGIPFGRTYDKSLVSTKAFGAYYYLFNTNVCIANGGGFDHLYRCNILTQRAWITSTSKWYLYGARLMYKDIR